MKFWQKIFLYSVTLFLVLLSGTGALLVEKVYGENLQAAIERAINKCVDIEYAIYLNADYIIDVDVEDLKSMKNWLDIIINGYAISDNTEPVNIEVYTADNVLIMSNIDYPLEMDRPELVQIPMDQKAFIIREIEGRKYVFISAIINVKNIDFKLVLSKDVTFVYEQKKTDYQFLGMISIGVTFILALGMLIISKHLTYPIVELSRITKEIAMGNYSKRVIERKNNDEVGILEENFNMMINEIEKNIKELQDLSEARQRFIDSLNHEIKTPITSIIGYSELLLKSKVNEATKIKALSYIHSEAKRLEQLNSTLLKLILLREEKVVQSKVSLKTCLEQVEERLRYKLENQKVLLEPKVEAYELYMDSNQLEILLMNLLDNSIKASRSGDKIKINGKWYVEQKEYVLTIEDQGIGIPKEDLDKIMEPFYMVDKARTRKYNGIGLGLAICKEICERNKIQLDIESQVGVGTWVTLRFRVGD